MAQTDPAVVGRTPQARALQANFNIRETTRPARNAQTERLVRDAAQARQIRELNKLAGYSRNNPMRASPSLSPRPIANTSMARGAVNGAASTFKQIASSRPVGAVAKAANRLPAPAKVAVGGGVFAAGQTLAIGALDGQISRGDVGAAAGAGIGSTVGTFAGAAIGSLAGPIGTAIGSFVGGAIGATAGQLLGQGLFPNRDGPAEDYIGMETQESNLAAYVYSTGSLSNSCGSRGTQYANPSASYEYENGRHIFVASGRAWGGTYTCKYTLPSGYAPTGNHSAVYSHSSRGYGFYTFDVDLEPLPENVPTPQTPNSPVRNPSNVPRDPATGEPLEALPETEPFPQFPPIPFIPALPAALPATAPTHEPGAGPQKKTQPARQPGFSPGGSPKPASQPNTTPKANPSGGAGKANPPPPARTKKNNKCGCNQGLLSGVQNLLSGNGLTAANTALLAKIDATTTATGAGVAVNLTKLQALQKFMETAWKATHADKIINLLTLATTLHNASMISRDIGETMGYVLGNALAVVGIKDERDNPLDVNEIVGNSVENFIKSVVGEEVYENTATFWQKSNRMLNAASNIVWTIRSINDASQEVMEWTAENTGKIGNALKKYGVVGERSYPWMAERVRAQDGYRRKLGKVFDGLESAENVANSLSQVTSNVREIQDEVSELGEARQRFTEAVSDLAPEETSTASPENQAIATADLGAAAASQGPDVTISTDGSRGPDNDTP